MLMKTKEKAPARGRENGAWLRAEESGDLQNEGIVRRDKPAGSAVAKSLTRSAVATMVLAGTDRTYLKLASWRLK